MKVPDERYSSFAMWWTGLFIGLGRALTRVESASQPAKTTSLEDVDAAIDMVVDHYLSGEMPWDYIEYWCNHHSDGTLNAFFQRIENMPEFTVEQRRRLTEPEDIFFSYAEQYMMALSELTAAWIATHPENLEEAIKRLTKGKNWMIALETAYTSYEKGHAVPPILWDCMAEISEAAKADRLIESQFEIFLSITERKAGSEC